MNAFAPLFTPSIETMNIMNHSITFTLLENISFHRNLRLTTSSIPLGTRRTCCNSTKNQLSTTAIMPTYLAAESMNDFRSSALRSSRYKSLNFNNITITADIKHPVFVAGCTNRLSGLSLNDKVPYVRDDLGQGVLMSMSDLLQAYISQGISNETTLGSLPPLWRPSPNKSSSSLIGVFTNYGLHSDCNITYPVSAIFTENYPKLPKWCFWLWTCTISASWRISTHEMSRTGETSVVKVVLPSDASFGSIASESPIIMNLASIHSFNNAEFIRFFSKNIGVAPEPIVAAIFATSLANLTSNKVDPSKHVTGDNSYTSELKIVQYGYGYNSLPTSVRLSLAVIMLYCVVTMWYIVYLVVTRNSSIAWNSAIGLVMLTLQSRSPDHLGHTSAGVESIETLRELVGIRVNSKENLELVFTHDREIYIGNLRKVVPNTAY